MPGRIVHLKKRQELKDFIKTSNAFVIDFTATWCNPCKTISPLIEQAWEQIKTHFDMVIVDADEGSDICSFMKVKGYPTLVSFINKEIAESVMGADIEGVKHFFNVSMSFAAAAIAKPSCFVTKETKRSATILAQFSPPCPSNTP